MNLRRLKIDLIPLVVPREVDVELDSMREKDVATRPRQIIAGRTVFVTGRAIERQYRFVPDEETVHTIWYCLGLVLRDYGVKLHAFVWMSNHYHLVLTDVNGELPDFMRDLNSKISRALNACRGHRGPNFARESYNLVVPADDEATLRHCAYTEANPCSAHLVEHAWEWEGVSSAAMDYGEIRTVLRPDFGMWEEVEPLDGIDETRARHRGKGDAPETVSIQLEAPPDQCQRSAPSLRRKVREQVRGLEAKAREERSEGGRPVVGMADVAARRFRDSPFSSEPFFQSEPQVSGTDAKARKTLKLQYRAFVNAYRQAWEAFKTDREVLFPPGTWWMQRRLKVRCACGPP